jgi:hypothetical protein
MVSLEEVEKIGRKGVGGGEGKETKGREKEREEKRKIKIGERKESGAILS